jgi:protoporphyrin/coproporphyrin ferrochelatase
MYDAILVMSFGGPEGPDDVLPFMENVTRGRGIPRERLIEVSAHYDLFGGVSPINAQNEALIAALKAELAGAGIDLPLYWGNRNWHPMIGDTLEYMRDDGVSRALMFVTSAFSSASGCRQYREDVARACGALGVGAPVVDKIRVFYNHPGFIEPMVDNVVASIESLVLGDARDIRLAFTAHSIPMSMADTSDYVQQLAEASRLVHAAVSARIGVSWPWQLVFQSRSGPPGQPWLEPDICDHLVDQHGDDASAVVMVPIGFISDHMEVVYDLDTQARERAASLGLPVRRAATVGTDPRFVKMIVQLIQERIALVAGVDPIRLALGQYPPNHDVCPADCCPMPQRPAATN